MANKKAIKLSEARIMVYLDNSTADLHFVRLIANKLQMDYGYTNQMLTAMRSKSWLYKEKALANPQRTYYHLSKVGRLKLIDANNIVAKPKEEIVQ